MNIFGEDVPEFDEEQTAYIVVGIKGPRKDSHVHVHFSDKEDITLNLVMVENLIREAGLEQFFTRLK